MQEWLTASKLGSMQAPGVGKQMQLRFGEDLGCASGKKQKNVMIHFHQFTLLPSQPVGR